MDDRQTTLRPADVAVAIGLAQRPGAPYQLLVDTLGMSMGGISNSVRRLERSKLLIPGRRKVSLSALTEFLEHGVPYAFPAIEGPATRGVPTAHAAPPLADRFHPDVAIVWPDATGTARGTSLVPLYPEAPRLATTDRRLYQAMALLDAIRLGRVRERAAAISLLRESYLRPEPPSTGS